MKRFESIAGAGRERQGLDPLAARESSGGGRISACSSVRLVQHQDVAGPCGLGGESPGPLARRGVDDPKPQRRGVGPGPRPTHALALDLVNRLADSCGVGQKHLEAADQQRRLDHVPRGAGNGGDDRRLPLEQPIQQAGLAGVGRADDGDPVALAHALSAVGPLERPGQLRLQRQQRPPRPRRHVGGQRLIREVDGRFEIGQPLQQGLPPRLVAPPERAAELGQGLAPLAFALGVDKIGDRLGLAQVELAGLEGPAGELPRLGQPQPPGQERLGDCIDSRRPPVQVQLGGVFAGVAARARRPQHQGLVEHGAVGALQPPQPRLPRRRQPPGEGAHGLARPGPREAQDRHSRAAGRGGQGEDGVAHGGPASPWAGPPRRPSP